MRLNKQCTAWLALAMAVLLAGTAVADDRDFLRKLAAPPNLIFILDTSGSMVGSPEEPGAIDNAIRPYAMQPAASVSGFYMAHPEARYFSVGPIGRDQVEAYAERVGELVVAALRSQGNPTTIPAAEAGIVVGLP